MEFITINLEKWNRKEHYEHFNGLASCSFNVTENIDVTDLLSFSKMNQIDFYPIYLFLVAKSVNQIKELRMNLVEGELGYYSYSNPSYTVFNKEKEIFYTLVTTYNSNFNLFLVNYKEDIEAYRDSLKLFPQEKIPENLISISSIPWVNFSSFDIHLKHGDYLLPIITNGQYRVEATTTYMPLSIRVNHSVTDGYHVGLFFKAFRENMQILCNELSSK